MKELIAFEAYLNELGFTISTPETTFEDAIALNLAAKTAILAELDKQAKK